MRSSRGHLGQAATGAACTATFPGERYTGSPAAAARPRPGRRRPLHPGHHLTCWPTPLAGTPTSGYGYYQDRTGKDRRLRAHIRQIEALGFTRHP
jgi:hypothetical protein